MVICYCRIENYSRALDLCKKTLSIQQKLLGKINSDYANTLFSYLKSILQLGMIEECKLY